MKALVIEDEKRAARRIRKMIEESGRNIDVSGVTGSVSETRQWFGSHEMPDLIFSDIQLGDGTVFDVFENLDNIPPVIFTTAYDEFALRAFKTNGIDYLLKPIDAEELHAAIDKYLALKGGEADTKLSMEYLASILHPAKNKFKSRFIVKVGEKLRSLQTDDISCFYSLMKATYLQTRQGKNYVIEWALDELENLLDPTLYFRINRKLIIHYESIDEVHMWSGSRLKVVLHCQYDEKAVVSRDRVKAFKAWLDR